jgi:acyl-CoA thioesterase I
VQGDIQRFGIVDAAQMRIKDQMSTIRDQGSTLRSLAQADRGRAANLFDQSLGDPQTEGIHLDRQGVSAENAHMLADIGDHHHVPAGCSHDLFAQQRSTAAFDQPELRIKLVRAVHRQIKFRSFIQRRQGDSEAAGLRSRHFGCRDTDDFQPLADAFAQKFDEMLRGRTGAKAQPHAVFNQLESFGSGFSFKLFSGHSSSSRDSLSLYGLGMHLQRGQSVCPPVNRGTSVRAGMLKKVGFAVAVSFAATIPAWAEALDDATCHSARSAAFADGPALSPQSMTIVAVGSSSTEGIVRNARNKVYPAALQASLSKLWPKAELTVVNKGKGGETMRDTIARFETDVLALKPSLVIWQLGVNDVLRYNGLEGRHEEIQSGLKILTDKGIPVVLLDLQYAPMVIKDPDALPMQALIDRAARTGPKGRVFHFKRFAAMKQLADTHQVGMAEMTDRDDLHMTDAMHVCVGQLLAEMISAKPMVATSAKP